MIRYLFAIAVAAIVGAWTFGAPPARAALLTTGPQNAPYGGYVCADVAGNNLALFTSIQAYDCHGSGNQQFQLIGTAIYALSGQRCVDVYYGGTTAGTPVESYACNGTRAQQWYYSYGRIINIGSYLCLDARDSTNGRQLIINYCNGSNSQQWQLK